MVRRQRWHMCQGGRWTCQAPSWRDNRSTLVGRMERTLLRQAVVEEEKMSRHEVICVGVIALLTGCSAAGPPHVRPQEPPVPPHLQPAPLQAEMADCIQPTIC